ncbi:MAG: hypothetical protein H5U37_06965, partial [Caldisericia bacterium]|nr:hypothetical protein [Caldisericia bacterium]
MKIIHFNKKKENNPELLNIVVPTKSVEGNLFKNLMKSIDENIKDLEMDVVVSAVESSGPEFRFSKSVNAGVESQDADYYLNVNDDVIISQGSLKKAIENMKSVKNLGLHGAVLRRPSGWMQHAGVGCIKPDKLNKDFIKWVFNLLLLPAPFYMVRSFIEYKQKNYLPLYHYSRIDKHHKGVVTGAFHLFDKDTYEKTGGYDENYKMGGEDFDFCLTVIKNKKKIRLDEKVCGIHLERAAGIRY